MWLVVCAPSISYANPNGERQIYSAPTRSGGGGGGGVDGGDDGGGCFIARSHLYAALLLV